MPMTVREYAKAVGLTRQAVINRLIAGTLKGHKVVAPNAMGYYWLIDDDQLRGNQSQGKS